MTSPDAAPRRLLVLCGLIPLPDMTQDEVDYLFRRLVEEAAQVEEVDVHQRGEVGS